MAWSAVRERLCDSVFYYCCGKDITPIAAFGAQMPLYVYVDRADGWMTELYARLARKGYGKVCDLATEDGAVTAERVGLTEWSDGTGTFLLLCVQGDAVSVYRALYGGVLPRCICNYRYEMPRRGEIEQDERRVGLVMGHCFDPRCRIVAEYAYYGDYGDRSARVRLYQREELE